MFKDGLQGRLTCSDATELVLMCLAAMQTCKVRGVLPRSLGSPCVVLVLDKGQRSKAAGSVRCGGGGGGGGGGECLIVLLTPRPVIIFFSYGIDFVSISLFLLSHCRINVLVFKRSFWSSDGARGKG